MVGASKILTVSYGTFSCTLEGFDDPFSTMRSIAEYFRDLAADDRYFGAEPPTPDADMLHRIAEREVQRRVESRVEDGSIVLRQTEDEVQTELVEPEAPAPVPEEPVPDTATQETVAEKLSRIRAVVSRGPAAATAAPAMAAVEEAAQIGDEAAAFEDEPISSAFADVETDTTKAPFDDVPETLLSDEDGVEEASAEQPADEAIAAETGQDEAEAAEEESLDDAPEAAEMEDTPAEEALDEAETFEAEAPEDTVEDETATEAMSAAEEAPAETAEHDTLILEEPIKDMSEIVAELEEEEEALGYDDDLAFGDEYEDESEELAALDGFDPSDDIDGEELVAEDDADDEMIAEDEEEGEEELLADDFGMAAAMEEADAEEQEDIVSDLGEHEADAPARVVTLKRADPLEQEVDEDSTTEDVDEEALLDELSAIGEDDEDIDDQDLEDDEPFEEDAEADEFEDETYESEEETPELVAALPAADEADEDDAPEATDDSLNQAIAGALAAGTEGSEESPKSEDRGEAAFDRILEETNSKLDETEGSRRRSAIAHLKAAVAATKADRLLKRMRLREEEEQEEQKEYRDDLAQVVRPRRPAPDSDEPSSVERPGPVELSSSAKEEEDEAVSPLMLVSELRVDDDETTEPAEPAAPVRPARVTTDMIRPRRISNTDLDDLGERDENDDDNLFEPEESFSEFAEKMGATELPDLLEAAAAYSAFVEGQKHFSRPQLMKRVASFEMNEEFTREAGLRSFGQLLRQGKIQKLKRGQFTIREDSRFRPEARIAGE